MSLFQPSVHQALDSNGNPISGATWNFYLTQTTTPTAVYANNALSVPLGASVTADSSGRFEAIFVDDTVTVRAILKNAGGATIMDIDPASGPLSAGQIGYVADGAGAITRTALAKLRDGRVSVADFIPVSIWSGMLAGTIADVTTYVQAALTACSAGNTLYFPFCAAGYHVSLPAGSDEKIFTLPAGVHVYMDDGAWIYPSTEDEITTVFTPLGTNILRVNIDGQSLAESDEVGEEPQEDRTRGPDGGISTWTSFSFGIRAYASEQYGFGAQNVTVVDSRFRNLHHAIQTQGCSYWKVINNRFERTELAAVWFSYLGGDSQYNIVEGNHFRGIGDCAVTWVSQGETGFSAAYNSQSWNVAVDTNLNAQGFAFNVEPGAGDPDLQHHFRMVGNHLTQLSNDRPHGTGGCTMQNVGESICALNTLQGASDGSNGDYGISCLESRHTTILGNTVVGFWGGGIVMDGSDDGLIEDNTVIDCGDAASGTVFPAISFALAYTTRRLTIRGNKIVFNDGYAHGSGGAFGIAGRTVAGTSEDICIENNTIVSPWGCGIGVYGGVGGNPVIGYEGKNNRIVRTSDATTAPWPLQLLGIQKGAETGAVLVNGQYGVQASSCAGMVLEGIRLRGNASENILGLYDFASSTGVEVENVHCSQTITTAITSAGTGTKWGYKVAGVPVPTYATSALALAGGVAAGGAFKTADGLLGVA